MSDVLRILPQFDNSTANIPGNYYLHRNNDYFKNQRQNQLYTKLNPNSQTGHHLYSDLVK